MKRVWIIFLVLLAGIGLVTYPFVSSYLNMVNGSKAIQDFEVQMLETEEKGIEEQRKLAEEYNSRLTGREISDPFIPGSGMILPQNYTEVLDYANHMMGYIEIPKINVYLPIYHGVSDDVLAKGIGHMKETAFPIGGNGNHAVLTGHTGLSTSKLFTDLTELETGDVFYIHILGEELKYTVDQIQVKLPDEVDELRPVPGKDYITLVTCTPYAVNTHRLLVRGVRTETEEAVSLETERVHNVSVASAVDKKAVIYGSGTAVLLLILFGIVRRIIGASREKAEASAMTRVQRRRQEPFRTSQVRRTDTGRHRAYAPAAAVRPDREPRRENARQQENYPEKSHAAVKSYQELSREKMKLQEGCPERDHTTVRTGAHERPSAQQPIRRRAEDTLLDYRISGYRTRAEGERNVPGASACKQERTLKRGAHEK